MASELHSHSPHISIWLELLGQRFRLADVLDTTAVVYEAFEVPEDCVASLVMAVDGVETRQEVMVFQGEYQSSQVLNFHYLAPHIDPS